MTASGFEISSLRAEDRLLLACAHPTLNTTQRANLLSLLETTPNFDWNYLSAMAQRHRLQQLLCRNLQQSAWQFVSAEIAAALKSAFKKNALKNNYLLGQLGHVLHLLQTANIAVVPYKGPTLAQQVYGDVALRVFSDLDLFIPKSYEAEVLKVLTANNFKIKYHRKKNHGSVGILLDHETTFTNGILGLNVDVNWKLEGHFRGIDSNSALQDLFDPFISFKLDGQTTLAFTPEDLLLVLSFHAAAHYWQNLLWIADVAAVIQKYPNLDWSKIITKAAKLGVLQILGINIYLANLLFELHLSAAVFSQLKFSKRAMRLSIAVIKNIFLYQGKLINNWYKIYFFVTRRDSLLIGIRDLLLFKLLGINAIRVRLI